MKIRHVFQPDDTGCGIACVAMLSGLSYNEVKQLMIAEKLFDTDTSYWGTSFCDLKEVLNKLEIKTANRRKFNRRRNIPARVAIASTNYDKKGMWRWVVFVRDIDGFYIYDPGKRRKKVRDLRGRMSGYYQDEWLLY